MFQDRLGSNRSYGVRFRPYGDEIGTSSNDRVKFGTYNRDGFTGLDYADQRYYAASYGRFNTADPYRASAGAGDPGSWNRYAYVGGDPINGYDPSGLFVQSANQTVTFNPSQDMGFYSTFEHFFSGVYKSSLINVMDQPAPSSEAVDVSFTTEEYRDFLADGVAGKTISDCSALAAYARALGLSPMSNTDFMNAFGVFVPNDDPSLRSAQQHGYALVGTDNYRSLLPREGTSGFQTAFQDVIGGDQAHHFAAYFQLGFHAGALVGGAAAYYADWFPSDAAKNNPRDVRLGVYASQLGADIKSGRVKKEEAYKKIEQICK